MGDESTQAGRTILYVSHNMNTVRQLCTRCVVLDHGKVVFDGDTEKAIAIYSEASFSLNARYDLRGVTRLNVPTDIFRAHSLEFVGKDFPIYYANEPLKFRVTWVSEQNIRGLCLRYTLTSSEQTPLGMGIIDQFADVEAGKLYTYDFEQDISTFISGDYQFFCVFYQRSQTGDQIILDRLPGFFSFRVENSAISIAWDTRYGGHFNFPTRYSAVSIDTIASH